MKIYLLEDEETIGMGLQYSLEQEGYEVTWGKTVSEAVSSDFAGYDLYILDVNLPDGNGYEVCKKIKEQTDTPVIFLTVIEEEVNVVMGLELGADDYITKPFRVRELLARVKSVLRRSRKKADDGVIRYQNLRVAVKEGKVYRADTEVTLTAMEYRLLLTLLTNQGTILTRNNLLEHIWDVDGNFVDDNTLSVYIKRLRDKLEEDASHPQIIKTVRGRGYVIGKMER